MIENSSTAPRPPRRALLLLTLALSPACPGQTMAGAAAPVPAADHSAPPAGSSVPTNPRSPEGDPRIGLRAGLYDAGEAAFGMERLLSLPKPAGFAPDTNAVKAWEDLPEPPPRAPGTPPPPGGGTHTADPYGGINSDLAFEGRTLFVGNYNGINFYDISDPARIRLLTSLICPGGQGDVSVYGHLLFMSVEAANGRLDCGTQGFPAASPQAPAPAGPAAASAPAGARGEGSGEGAEPVTTAETAGSTGAGGRRRPPMPPPSQDRIKGIRIFDISDITNPRQVADVQTCRGSHTHTLLVDPKDRDNVYIYVSGSAGVRPAAELSGCSGADPSVDPNTALFTIVVIKVPLAHPELARVVSSPRIFSDPSTGNPNGLWKGGNHGAGTQTTAMTRGCHDITVYSAIGLAAGACSGNGILLDISDPVNPRRIDAVTDPNYAFWHSANFSNDGSKVLFTDEWGGGTQPRCRATDPMNWGADAIFYLKKARLELASYYKMPAPQSDLENCVAHNGSMIPVPGRDIEVQAWYQGGVSIVDLTDAAHPVEIGYFDRGPISGRRHALGGQWSTYWYNGYIYGSEIVRGIDVFRLVPTRYLSENEIAAARQITLPELNVQNQPQIVWPANAITARAYLDQLARDGALPKPQLDRIAKALGGGERPAGGPGELAHLARELSREAPAARDLSSGGRMTALAEILRKNADR